MVVALLGGALLAAPAAARADEEILAATSASFVTPVVEIDQGERLTFRSVDPNASHNVTAAQKGADGRPLFASDTIRRDETSFVEGSQYLTTGRYAFVCTIHAGTMTGTLTVNSQGAPAQRPPSEPAPEGPPSSGSGSGTTSPTASPAPAADTTPPVITASLRAQRARTLRRRRALVLPVGLDEGGHLKVTVRIGRLRAGRAGVTLGSAGTRNLRIALSRAGVRAVRARRVLRVTVEAVDAAGNRRMRVLSVRLR